MAINAFAGQCEDEAGREIALGKATLVENTALLVSLAGRDAAHGQALCRDDARSLRRPPRAPRTAQPRAQQTAMLDAVALNMKSDTSFSSMAQRGSPRPRRRRRCCAQSIDFTAGDRRSVVNIDGVRSLAGRIRAEVAKAVIGQDETVSLLLCALFSRGHVLLEGVPGVAKTLLARAFARAVGLGAGRIQFTPDLMPGDIIGSNLFDFRTNPFNLVKGPIFNELILADEINRTPPKTQAALLEAMQERSVTIDGTRHALRPWFIVVATQNPIEHQGTYALPEAQLDRFLFKHVLDYPSEAEEMKIVATYGVAARFGVDPAPMGVETVARACRAGRGGACVSSVRMTDEVLSYIVNLVRGHANERRPDDGRLAARRRHAGVGGAGAGGAGRARLRDSRRREAACRAGAAPSLRAVARPRKSKGRTSDQALAAVIERIEAPR